MSLLGNIWKDSWCFSRGSPGAVELALPLGWLNDSVVSDSSVLAVDLAEAGESKGLNCVKIAVHSFQSIPR